MTWKTDQQWEKNESKMIFKEINIIYNALLKGIRKRERRLNYQWQKLSKITANSVEIKS